MVLSIALMPPRNQYIGSRQVNGRTPPPTRTFWCASTPPRHPPIVVRRQRSPAPRLRAERAHQFDGVRSAHSADVRRRRTAQYVDSGRPRLRAAVGRRVGIAWCQATRASACLVGTSDAESDALREAVARKEAVLVADVRIDPKYRSHSRSSAARCARSYVHRFCSSRNSWA